MTAKLPPTRRRASASIPLSWRPAGQSEHFSVEHDPFHNILRVTRVSDSYPSTGALREAHDWLLTIFAKFERKRVVLVWDGRRGKLRNDPEFEEAIKQVLPPITEGWCEFVSINNTPVVKVQFSRWTREGTTGRIQAFNDEREALAYAVEVSQQASRQPKP